MTMPRSSDTIRPPAAVAVGSVAQPPKSGCAKCATKKSSDAVEHLKTFSAMAEPPLPSGFQSSHK